MLTKDEHIALHNAKLQPSRWSGMILDLAKRDPHAARIEALKVEGKEVDDGFSRSALRLVATATIEQIDKDHGKPGASGSRPRVMRSSMEFYKTPGSWSVTGGTPFTPR